MRTLLLAAVAACVSVTAIAGPLDTDPAPSMFVAKASPRAMVGALLRAGIDEDFTPVVSTPPTDHQVFLVNERVGSTRQAIFIIAPKNADSVYGYGAAREVNELRGDREFHAADRLGPAPMHNILNAARAEFSR